MIGVSEKKKTMNEMKTRAMAIDKIFLALEKAGLQMTFGAITKIGDGFLFEPTLANFYYKVALLVVDENEKFSEGYRKALDESEWKVILLRPGYFESQVEYIVDEVLGWCRNLGINNCEVMTPQDQQRIGVILRQALRDKYPNLTITDKYINGVFADIYIPDYKICFSLTLNLQAESVKMLYSNGESWTWRSLNAGLPFDDILKDISNDIERKMKEDEIEKAVEPIMVNNPPKIQEMIDPGVNLYQLGAIMLGAAACAAVADSFIRKSKAEVLKPRLTGPVEELKSPIDVKGEV